MKQAALDTWLLAWPGTASDIKWQDDLVYTVVDKMFAVYCLRGPQAGYLSFKVDDDRFLELTDRDGFQPAPYLARAHWVLVADPSALPRTELKQLLRRSYELVAAKLPKKTQRALGLLDSA